MIFRPDRRRRGEDRFLHHKMLLFAAGAVLGIGGIAFELAWLVYVGIAVLATGMLLRLIDRRHRE